MIRRSLQKLIQWAQNHNTYKCESVSVHGSDNTIGATGMNFSLYHADGGYIVEYRQYDHKTDRNTNKLHVITSDQDLGERIGEIVTLELLRR